MIDLDLENETSIWIFYCVSCLQNGSLTDDTSFVMSNRSNDNKFLLFCCEIPNVFFHASHVILSHSPADSCLCYGLRLYHDCYDSGDL